MTELFNEAIAWYNFPLTVLLCLVVLYWIVAAFGILGDGMDAGDLDVDADIDAHHSGDGVGGLAALMRFVNMDSVPAMIVITILASTYWVLSMVLNHLLNPNRTTVIALAILGGGFVLSTIITKIITIPFSQLFKSLRNSDKEAQIPIIGRSGIVKSGEVTTDFGQVEITKKGPPLLIHARIHEGNARLKRGDQCIVIDEIEGKGIFYVKSLKL
jgi:hypothetical protein